MKKVINGLLYDTEKAEAVANYSNNRGYGDFKALEETLYRTKNGRWFIHGIGGAMTSYAVEAGSNSWSGSEQIKPIDEEYAKEFLAEYGDPEDYEKWFEAKEA
jgi:hypothetical protein